MLLALRLPLRRAFGARIAYLAWLVMPCALFAAWLPAPVAPIAAAGMLEVVASSATHLPAATDVRFDARPFIVGLWLLGSVVALAVLGLRQWRFERHLRRSRMPPMVPDTRMRHVRAEASGPAVVGLWRPRIVLPDDFEMRWSTAERELILAHEKVHIERGDTRINAGMALIGALNWFNPLFHLAAGRMRIDQELACDAGVLARHPHSRRCYAEAMLKAQLAPASFGMFPPPAACRWTDGNVLKERIAMLKQARSSRPRHVAGIVVVLVLAGAAACVTWASQSVETAPRDEFAAQRMIDARVRIGTRDDAPLVRVLIPSGVTYAMRGSGVGDDVWDALLTPRRLEDGNLELAMVIHADGRPTATPSMIVRPGLEATLELASAIGRKPLKIAATLAEASASSTADAAEAHRPPNYAESTRIGSTNAMLDDPIDGSVLLRVRVGVDGRPLDIEALEVSAATLNAKKVELLTEKAKSVASGLIFAPARRSGGAIEAAVIVPVTFGMRATHVANGRGFGDASILDEIVLNTR
ncbi:MAG: hypothetical protein J0L88_10070 [Xanthomonadales bacterium]|nr:hypothetical protein [Xanthomonadales bacterium]